MTNNLKIVIDLKHLFQANASPINFSAPPLFSMSILWMIVILEHHRQ
jgi:hypothetical protein